MERQVYSGKEFNAKYGHIVMVKLLNERENHNGYQFKEGLNVDTIPFNTQEDCCAGGIYFCQFHDMYTYLTYVSASTDELKVMKYAREVTVPDDAKVCIEQSQFRPEIKFKADKIILGRRVLIDIFCNGDVQEARESRIHGWTLKSNDTAQHTIQDFRKFLQTHAAKIMLRGISSTYDSDAINAIQKSVDEIIHKKISSNTLADKCWAQVLENSRKIGFD